MPNIENLRKQAKSYLRWHRERYYPVAAQIRWILPRYRDQSDREILDADFKLSDAQELVARKHGFADWPALIKGIETVTKSTASDNRRPFVLSAEPQLFVSDINVSCQFYVRKLGFEVAFQYGEPPFYAQVFRDGARLNLRKVGAPVFDTGFRAREVDALSATLTVDDPKQLFLEYQAAGAPFHQPLRAEPWGARTFIVQDPDGNLIAFSGEAT
ncbi:MULTISPECIES: VOC family protein [unclassified Rhizobium]|uniref:bleomycin resistance protein n=1 Tax=unclassified Rhizobium TaxID=2613769 RepID=UPI00160B4C20|nr:MULTISPECIES: VOC family protein [unclassified Rhizobium]MBB3541055.1 catechol 2,3-dioxygenase-like lactoylglutathione lyase family enzyme [Rhizobium sp. BK399]MCS3743832.1 catechol 2,3-dioxygenase-like lactoylglutathione lyase family enzyme [Rhizobium sp. BK661]MCS4093741.1 catechol 2,3-dioxygenase-like lactoylglutathione lyase family enzyme [Rhizobium sp. BK176]